jgi:hypothetical protein
VSILLPAHLTALSNMPEVSSTHVKKDGSLLKKVVFDSCCITIIDTIILHIHTNDAYIF